MILVFVEVSVAGEDGTSSVSEVSLETVTFARTLAERIGGPVHAVIVGVLPEKVVDELADELGGYGVAQVHHATGAAFDAFSGAAWAAAVQAAAGWAGGSGAALDTGADAVVAPGTPRGMEVAAHLAARLDVPMAANVTGVGAADGGLRVVRQVLGGGVLEEMDLPQRPAVLTVAGHAVQAQQGGSGSATLHEFSPEVADADLVARVVSTEVVEELDRSAGLKSSRVVVGAGRGAGSANGFDDVVELAELLGGAIGVSRVVTSLGWRAHHEQIGQTGSRISPELYIPCGISGAIQHWAGCSSSKTIVAINTDEDAPMVTKATYAVIGDMHEVVPAINAEIKKRRG
jgi:electron transfer flavoprotein alpha subunit